MSKATFDADFGKFVSELTRVDVKLREFEPAADRVSARLQRMADSLNGNKLAEQAAIAVAAIGKIEGGVRGLNEGELRKYGALIDAATEKLIRQGREVPSALANVKAALDQQRQALEATAQAAKASSEGIGGGLTGAIGQGLGIGVGMGAFDLVTAGVSRLKDEIAETLEEGQKLTQLQTAFEQLQGGPEPAARAMADLRSATRGLVSDIDLLQAADKASLLGLGEMGIKTDELASIAVRLGKAMGQEAAKSVDDLTTALARQSPQILDNLGIKVDLTAATEKYAAGLGKTVDALTDEEKKFAFASAAMDAARTKANTLGEQELTLSEQIDRVGTSLDGMQAGLGRAVNESGLLADLAGSLADRLDSLREHGAAVGEEFGSAVSPLSRFLESYGRIESISEGAAKGINLLVIPALGALDLALEGTATQLDRMQGLLDFAESSGQIDPRTLPIPGRDRTLLDPTMGQGKRAQDWLKAYEAERTKAYQKEQEERLKKIEQGEAQVTRKLEQAAEQRRRKLAEQVGRDDLEKGTLALEALKGLGAARPSDAVAKQLFGTIFEAREVAKAIEPGLVGGFTTALTKLAAHPALVAAARQSSQKIVEGILDPSRLSAKVEDSLAGVTGWSLSRAISGLLPDSTAPNIIGSVGGSAFGRGLVGIGSSELKKLEPFGVTLDEINTRFDTFITKTRTWQGSVVGVGQAFAHLSQVVGELDPLTQGVGTFMSGLGAAEQLVTSIGRSFDSTFKFGESALGQTAASGIAAGLTGWQIGTGSGLSPWRAAGTGALAGAAGGALYGGAGMVVGAIAGATSAYFGAQKAQSELRKAKDLQAEALVAQYGTLDALLETVGALGLSQQSFLEKYYGEPKAFAQGVNDLNNALTREKNTADALGTSLEKVRATQGVLSVADRAQLGNPRAGGPLEGLVEGFRAQQTQSLIGGLERILQQDGPLSASLVRGVGQSFPAALAALEGQGASPVEALKTLMPLLDEFRAKAVEAGMGSTPGFDALNSQLAVLKDERLGPLIERASGAGQALGALNNLDLLDQDAFSGYAAAITETVAGMDLLSEQGQNAMRLIRGPLQNVWQLQEDFGFAVDGTTQKLLDQAEASGLVGDKFRPTKEKLVLGIERIADAAETLVDIFAGDLVDGAKTGADEAGQSILDAFDRIRPKVRVEYEYAPPEAVLPPVSPGRAATGAGSGADAVQRATASGRGGDIYMDSELVGYHTLRHAGDFADAIGA